MSSPKQVFAALVLVLAILCPSISYASDIDSDIAKFRKSVTSDFQNWTVYDDFIAAMDHAGILGTADMAAFKKVIAKALDPDGLKGQLVNLDGMEGYHRLGLAMYDKGYEQESVYLLDAYKNTRKYTPEQGLRKARELYNKEKQQEKALRDGDNLAQYNG